MNLYQIDDKIQALMESADPVTGEIAFDLMEQLEGEKKDKQLNIIKVIIHLKNEDTLIETEMQRLKVMKEQREKRQEWLKKYLASSMEIDGVREIDFVIHKAKFKKNPPKLVITDMMTFIEQFGREKLEVLPDKEKAKEALQMGQTFSFCELVQDERLDII